MKYSFYCLLGIFIVFEFGCLWNSDSDGNYSVIIDNKTDDEITVYYDRSSKPFDNVYVYSTKIDFRKGDSQIIKVKDKYYDADVKIEYRKLIKAYDVDPNFWGEFSVIVKVSDFITNG